MSFNKVQTMAEVEGYKFIDDQSTLLHVTDWNATILHGINVLVEKPERGDVMCVTLYKDADGNLLPSTQQEIKWIKGETVDYTQWSKELDPVGIVYRVNGRVASVRYKTESSGRWSECDRWMITGASMTDGVAHTAKVVFNGWDSDTKPGENGATINRPAGIPAAADFTWTSTSVEAFCAALQEFLAAREGNSYYTCEYVVDADGSEHCIVNAKFFDYNWNTISIPGLTATRCIGREVKEHGQIRRKNGGVYWWAGCCYEKFLQWRQNATDNLPTAPMTSILSEYPVSRAYFNGQGGEDGQTDYCAIMRQHYASYEDYIKDNMAKYPSGLNALGTSWNDGPTDTATLAAVEYLGVDGNRYPLHVPANYCDNVSVNGPGLTKGHWWLPCVREMYDLMTDITYGCEGYTINNCDPVNRTIYKLNNNSTSASNGFKFSFTAGSTDRWASTRLNQSYARGYYGYSGYITSSYFYYSNSSAPVTLIHF